MARVNIDDDLESHDEFWKLLPLAGGDRDAALGKLVRFFRIAQKAFGEERPMTRNELDLKGLGCMIESGWAVETAGGFRARGGDEQFAWYKQKIEAGKKGGRPKKAECSENNRPVSPVILPVRSVNPLAPAPAPAPNTKSTTTNSPLSVVDNSQTGSGIGDGLTSQGDGTGNGQYREKNAVDPLPEIQEQLDAIKGRHSHDQEDSA